MKRKRRKKRNRLHGSIYREQTLCHTVKETGKKHRKKRYVAEIHILKTRFRFRSTSKDNATRWMNTIIDERDSVIIMLNSGMSVQEIKIVIHNRLAQDNETDTTNSNHALPRRKSSAGKGNKIREHAPKS